MRPDLCKEYHGPGRCMTPMFVLKRDDDTLCPYISNESARDQSRWRYTGDIRQAVKFKDHTDAMLFVMASSECLSNFLNGKRFSIVKVAEVEVVTTEWKEVQ